MTQVFSSNVNEGSPRYYGWVVMAAAVVGMIFSSGPMLYGSMGLFVPHFEAAFGWTRSEIMLSLALNTIATVISAPICGRLIDRFGVRRVLLPSILVFVVVWAVIPFFTVSLAFFYFIIFLLGLITVGTQSISYIRVISAWFDQYRGLAIGITASGIGLSYMLTPLIVETIMRDYGWNYAYWIMALLVLFVSFPLMAFSIVNSPRKADASKDTTSKETKEEGYGLSLAEASKSKEFWLIAIAIGLFSLVLTGLIPHVVPIMLEKGFDTQTAALTASVMGLATFVGRIGVGFLVDRIFAPYVAIVFFSMAAVGLLLLSLTGIGAFAYLAAVMIGLGFGAESDLIGYLVSRYFGLKAFGEIYGYIYGAFLIGAGSGPLLLGVGYDILEGYTQLLQLFGIVCGVGCTLFLFLGKFPDFKQNSEASIDYTNTVTTAK